MKIYVSLLLATFVSFVALAQDDLVITASKKVSKAVTPTQVVDSLQKKFPDAKAVEYYQTPAGGVARGWAVSEDDNLEGGTIDYYTLAFKRDDAQYYGLYKADGTLVKSKFEEKNVELPDAVKTSLKKLGGGDYKNYTLLSKNYFKNVNHSTAKEYYEVSAVSKSNKKDKKTVIIDPAGNVIKVK